MTVMSEIARIWYRIELALARSAVAAADGGVLDVYPGITQRVIIFLPLLIRIARNCASASSNELTPRNIRRYTIVSSGVFCTTLRQRCLNGWTEDRIGSRNCVNSSDDWEPEDDQSGLVEPLHFGGHHATKVSHVRVGSMAPVRSDASVRKTRQATWRASVAGRTAVGLRKTTGRRRGRRRKSRNLTNTSRSNALFLANVTTTDDPSDRLPARPARCMWLAHPGGTFPSKTPFKPPMSMPSSIVVVDDKRFRRPSLNRNCLRLFSSG